jgi:hypothetical protein
MTPPTKARLAALRDSSAWRFAMAACMARCLAAMRCCWAAWAACSADGAACAYGAAGAGGAAAAAAGWACCSVFESDAKAWPGWDGNNPSPRTAAISRLRIERYIVVSPLCRAGPFPGVPTQSLAPARRAVPPVTPTPSGVILRTKPGACLPLQVSAERATA